MKARYYQLLDWSQSAWVRFRESEVGCAMAWLVPRIGRGMWWLLKLTLKVYAVFIVVAVGMMLALLLAVTGNMKEAIRSLTKISVVIIGLVAAKKVVTSNQQIAEAIKSIKADTPTPT